MQQFTKKAIMESFIKLLAQEPLNKITVKKIIDDCGINRNTFYYHFEDIYDLVDQVFIDALGNVPKLNWDTDTWQENFMTVMHFIMENKRFIHNLYTSMSRERLIKYIEEVSQIFVEGLVRDCAQGTGASEEDIQAVTRLEKYLLMGCMAEWLTNGMKNQLSESFFELGTLYIESIHLLLESLSNMSNI